MQRNPAILPDDFPKFAQSAQEALVRMSERLSSVRTIYYPCCFKDRQLEKIFPNARFTYLDTNPDSFANEALTTHTVIVADAHEYVCSPKADLVVLLNPETIPKTLVECVEEFGYVLANDYHQTARALAQNPAFTLLGCEDLEKGWLPSESAKRWITPVRSDEEWKTLQPASFHRIERAKLLVYMDFYKVFEETLSVSGMIEWHRRMTEKILKNERKLTDEDCDEFPDPRISEFAKLLPRIPMQEERLTPDSLYLFQKRG